MPSPLAGLTIPRHTLPHLEDAKSLPPRHPRVSHVPSLRLIVHHSVIAIGIIRALVRGMMRFLRLAAAEAGEEHDEHAEEEEEHCDEDGPHAG